VEFIKILGSIRFLVEFIKSLGSIKTWKILNFM
jgi:hypothetical protein